MGSFLVKLLTNPENFKFYSGNSEGQVGNVSSADSFGQKSIPFGKDRPGGGSSNQPYIKGVGLTGTGIKTVGSAWSDTLNAWSQPGLLPINAAFFKPTNGVGWAGLAQNTLNQFTSLGPLASSIVYTVDNLPNIPDSIIRGGLKALPRSVIDATRLTKYFLDYKSVNGVLFLAKQNLLSRVAVKTEPARTSAAYLYGVLNGGVYTPLSAIGQAATGFAGIHLNDKGIDPTGIIPQLSIQNYQDIAFNRNKNDISNETSKGYQRRVDKKINKLNKLKTQLEDAQKGYEANKVFEGSIEERRQVKVTYNGKIYPSFYEAALAQVLGKSSSSSINPAQLQFLNQGTLTDLSFLTPEEQKILDSAKQTDEETRRDIEKEISENQKQKADNEKQIKKLPEQIQDTEEELEELTLGGKYKNRLLRLWDKFGLDVNNPVDSTKTTLLSYGGGPGSILGIGKTKIKFATLNDGITPARTGFNMEDPYADFGYLNYGPGRPNIFSSNRMYRVGESENSIFFKSGYTVQDYFNDSDYFSKLSNSSKLIEDNSSILQPWVTISKSSEPKKYSTWADFNFKLQQRSNTPGFGNVVTHETKEDFRKILNPGSEENSTFLSVSPSYLTKNIETRLGLGGKRGGPGVSGNRSSYSTGKLGQFNEYLGPVDTINALPIYRSELTNQPSEDLTNDIIPFKISILDNNDVSKFFHLHFRAFIDDFSDSYQSNWKKIEYMGRGEKFYKYGGFDRDLNIGFTVAAQSKEELIPIYRKLNFLVSTLAPFYTGNGYMAGNIAYITMGDYLTNQSGIINSISVDIDKESPWEIGIDINGDRDPSIPRLPFMVKVKMKFTPIHQFRPEINKFGTTIDPKTLDINNMYPDNKSTFGNQRYISNIPLNGKKETNPLYIGTERPQLTNVFKGPVSPPSNPDNVINTPPGALDENIFYANQNYLYSELGVQPLSSQDVLNQTPNPNPSPDLTSPSSPGSPFEGESNSAFSFTPTIP
jgi:hypothetical protein